MQKKLWDDFEEIYVFCFFGYYFILLPLLYNCLYFLFKKLDLVQLVHLYKEWMRMTMANGGVRIQSRV